MCACVTPPRGQGTGDWTELQMWTGPRARSLSGELHLIWQNWHLTAAGERARKLERALEPVTKSLSPAWTVSALGKRQWEVLSRCVAHRGRCYRDFSCKDVESVSEERPEAGGHLRGCRSDPGWTVGRGDRRDVSSSGTAQCCPAACAKFWTDVRFQLFLKTHWETGTLCLRRTRGSPTSIEEVLL